MHIKVARAESRFSQDSAAKAEFLATALPGQQNSL